MSEFQKWAMPNKKGLLVRYPRTKAVLSESGGWIDWIGADGRYWRKTVRQGDVKVFDERQQPPVTSVTKVESSVTENEGLKKRTRHKRED